MSAALNILIGTPAYGALVTTKYLHTVIGLFTRFKDVFPDAKVSIKTFAMTAVDMARNLLATAVLMDPKISHLLFIDADMGCDPKLIFSMLDLDKPVVGCIYPRRTLDLDRAVKMAAQVSSGDELQAVTNDYVSPSLVAHPNGQGGFVVDVNDQGFTRVHAVGTGIMLIKRDVFVQMKRIPGLWIDDYESSGWAKGLLQCFKPMDNDRGIAMSEDMSFCRRWTEQCGGEIWANVTESTTHVGTFAFKGRYEERLKRDLVL